MTTEEQKVSYVCIDQETPECATAVASWTVTLSWDTYTQKWEIEAHNYEADDDGPYCPKCDGDMEKVDLQQRTWGLNAKCQLHGPDHPEYLCPVLNEKEDSDVRYEHQFPPTNRGHHDGQVHREGPSLLGDHRGGEGRV